MLNFKIRHIIAYAYQFEDEVAKSFVEFFKDKDPEIYDTETAERLKALFNEYLTFEYRNNQATTFAAEYCLKNPDHRPAKEIDELKQIVETQHHEPFEIVTKDPGKTITVLGLFSGKQYKVTDIQASLNSPDYGTIFNRIARVNHHWYFIGSDPLVFPFTQTTRARKMLQESKKPEKPTCLEYKDIIISQAENTAVQKTYTLKEVKDKRKELINKFNQLAVKYRTAVTVEAVIDFIYHENYSTNFADFFTDLHDKLKLPEAMFIEHTELFNKMWNYFPHQTLNGKSPAELAPTRSVSS